MPLKNTLALILSRVMTPKELLDLYAETYAKVETGLPLYESEIKEEIKLNCPPKDSIEVILLEGGGIPALTPSAQETNRIVHQFFYNSNGWFEVGHEAEQQMKGSNVYIPNYSLQIIRDMAYPIEAPYIYSPNFERPYTKSLQRRGGITIPTNVPEDYVFGILDEKMQGNIYGPRNIGPTMYDKIFLIFQKISDSGKYKDKISRYQQNSN